MNNQLDKKYLINKHWILSNLNFLYDTFLQFNNKAVFTSNLLNVINLIRDNKWDSKNVINKENLLIDLRALYADFLEFNDKYVFEKDLKDVINEIKEKFKYREKKNKNNRKHKKESDNSMQYNVFNCFNNQFCIKFSKDFFYQIIRLTIDKWKVNIFDKSKNKLGYALLSITFNSHTIFSLNNLSLFSKYVLNLNHYNLDLVAKEIEKLQDIPLNVILNNHKEYPRRIRINRENINPRMKNKHLEKLEKENHKFLIKNTKLLRQINKRIND